MKTVFIIDISTRNESHKDSLKIAKGSQTASRAAYDLPPSPSDDGLTPVLPEGVRR